MFGVTLAEVMGRPDHDNHNIPIVVEKAVEYLYNNRADTVQGVFRLSGSTQQIQALRKQFDTGEKFLGILWEFSTIFPKIHLHDFIKKLANFDEENVGEN